MNIQELGQRITVIQSKVRRLSEAISCIGLPQETPLLRQQCASQIVELKKQIADAKSQLKFDAHESVIVKEGKKQMATSLRQIELSFQQCCSTYFEKQKVLPTVASPAPAPPSLSTSAVPPSNGASPAAPTSPTGGREPQVVQMTSDTHTLHLQLAQDRAREAREIERGLREVNQLVTEFGVMVNEGQESLDAMQHNTQQTVTELKEGNKNLTEASNHEKKGRCMYIVIFILVAVAAVAVAIAVILPIVLKKP